MAEKLAGNPEFTADVKKIAAEMGVKAGLLINALRSALTGQAVGPSAYHLFVAIGRDRAIARLRAA